MNLGIIGYMEGRRALRVIAYTLDQHARISLRVNKDLTIMSLAVTAIEISRYQESATYDIFSGFRTNSKPEGTEKVCLRE